MPWAKTTDGALVRWHDLGGSGPDLLAVHATGFHGLVWQPVADRLRRSFHCWSLDLRGHGDSSQPDLETFSWDLFPLDIRAVLDELGLERPFGLGHSLGAASLLKAEARWPGTFRALYLYEPAVHLPDGPVDDDGSSWAEMTRRRRATFASRDEARRNFSGKAPMNAFDPDVLDAYVEHGLADGPDGTVHLKCTPETEAAVFLGFTTHDLHARLSDVRCAAVVASSYGPAEGSPGGPTLAERLPHARAVELAGLDHFGPLCRPDVLAESVERLWPEGRPAD